MLASGNFLSVSHHTISKYSILEILLYNDVVSSDCNKYENNQIYCVMSSVGFGNIPGIFHGINLQEMYYFDVPALDMKQLII